MRTRTDVAAAFLKSIVDVRLRRLPRGSQAEYETAQQGKPKRERENLIIETEVLPAVGVLRRISRVRRAQQINSPVGDDNSRGPAEQSDDDALNQQLADDAPATGAECRAQRNLFLSSTRASQRQVGDVGARDEQDKS